MTRVFHIQCSTFVRSIRMGDVMYCAVSHLLIHHWPTISKHLNLTIRIVIRTNTRIVRAYTLKHSVHRIM